MVCVNACIRMSWSLYLSTRLWTSLRGLVLIFGTIHRILIAPNACYLISTLRQYASMVELIKPDVGYVTGSVTVSHIWLWSSVVFE